MEVADEIVVINEGRVEQVGTPDELYETPANDFVMSFLGDVTRIAGVSVRPHDVDVSTTPILAGSTEGTVSRLLKVGFEVRLNVLTVAGDDVQVVLSRAEARALDLREGSTVWVTAAPGAAVVPAMRVAG